MEQPAEAATVAESAKETVVEEPAFNKPESTPVLLQNIKQTDESTQAIPLPAEPQYITTTTINEAAKVAVQHHPLPAVVPAKIERRGRPRKISLGYELYSKTVKQTSTPEQQAALTNDVLKSGWEALEEAAKNDFEEKALLERDARNLILRAAKASRFSSDSAALVEERKPRARKSDVKYTDDSDRIIEADRFSKENDDDEEEFEVDEEEPKKIERRGRPRKDASSLISPKPVVPPGEKKGRGRPRKITEEELKRKRDDAAVLSTDKKVKKDDGLPDEEDVRDAILVIMKEENLETLTLNKIKQDLGVKFNFDSSLMKEFIKNTVDQLLATL